MKQRTILVAGVTLTEELLEKLDKEGVSVVHFTHQSAVRHIEGNPHCKEVVLYTGDESFIQFYKKMLKTCIKHNCDAIIPLRDSSIVPAAMVSRQLNLIGLSEEAAACCQDKVQMRKKIQERDQNNVSWQLCKSTKEVESFFINHSESILIKPIWGVGSVGVSKVQNIDAIAQAFQLASSSDYTRKGAVLCESFIEGAQYSVEGYSVDGVYFPVAITETLMSEALRGSSHIQPTGLAFSSEKKIFQYVSEILTAIEFNLGVSHVEVILNESGIYLIEINGRVCGGAIDEITLFTRGVDLFEVQCRLFMGETIEQDSIEPKSNAACIRYNHGDVGKSIKSLVMNEVKSSPNAQLEYAKLQYKEGETITTDDARLGRLSRILISGNTREEVITLGEKVNNSIKVQYV